MSVVETKGRCNPLERSQEKRQGGTNFFKRVGLRRKLFFWQCELRHCHVEWVSARKSSQWIGPSEMHNKYDRTLGWQCGDLASFVIGRPTPRGQWIQLLWQTRFSWLIAIFLEMVHGRPANDIVLLTAPVFRHFCSVNSCVSYSLNFFATQKVEIVFEHVIYKSSS